MTHKSSVCISGTCLLESGERRVRVQRTRTRQKKESYFSQILFQVVLHGARSNAAGWICKWSHEEVRIFTLNQIAFGPSLSKSACSDFHGRLCKSSNSTSRRNETRGFQGYPRIVAYVQRCTYKMSAVYATWSAQKLFLPSPPSSSYHPLLSSNHAPP